LDTSVQFDPHHLQLLSRTFEGLSESALTHILQEGKKYEIDPGEYLFRQGSHDNTLYIVLSGRLRAVLEDHHGIHILGDIGVGEPVGEYAMFTNEPRMASVLAIRKTMVLEITKETYFNIVSQNPVFASTLTSVLIKRINNNILEQNRSGAPKNIALINLQPLNDLGDWTNEMEKTLKGSGISTQVFNDGALPEDQYRNIFDTLEQHNGLNVLVCSEAYPNWSKQCVIYADLVIVTTTFSADTDLYQIEKTLDLYSKNITNKKIYIVFLHEGDAAIPNQTSRWLSKRKVSLHLHIRRNHPGDIRRFCRVISNQAVGLVLGGGGTKGFAHVGAVKALLDAGVEIDFVGGTSAGALYGILMSYHDFNFNRVHAVCEESVRRKLTSKDITLPVLSLMSGKKVYNFIREMFGQHELEDIWVNSYCVSSNFSKSGASVHDKGSIYQKVTASIAIPGIFPPVVIDQELHVDGGVVDNLPIEPMYRFPLRHIIAISLSNHTNSQIDCLEIPSARALLWDKLRGKKRPNIPGIGSLIVDSLTLNSRQRQDSSKSKASLYIELDLKGVNMLDDKKWSETMMKGKVQVEEFLKQLPNSKKFWLEGGLSETAEELKRT
jgi:NTE family protein